MFPLTFNMNFKNKDVVAFYFDSERLVSHDQSPQASKHLPILFALNDLWERRAIGSGMRWSSVIETD